MIIAELIEKELNRCKNAGCNFDLSRVFYSDSFTHTHNPSDFLKNKTPAQRKKLLLSVLNHLRLKRWKRKEIALLFSVTPRTIGNWLNDLKNEYKKEFAVIPATEFAGATVAFYDEMRADAMRLADCPSTAANGRLKAIQTALQTENSKHDFLERVGFFEGMNVKPFDGGADQRVNFFCQ